MSLLGFLGLKNKPDAEQELKVSRQARWDQASRTARSMALNRAKIQQVRSARDLAMRKTYV